MKTRLFKMFAFTLVFIGLNATAQTRYIDNIFDSVTVTSDVVYGQNVTILPLLQQQPPAVAPLLCDIYEPKNDTLTDRPVIILMHTGSFLPAVLNGQATGSKSDNSVVENCMRWAKKGYVAVAMSYRQGWNPTSPSQTVRTATILQAAYRGIHDSKAMVRHLRKTADVDGNPYGIDESKIVIGGQGTGAYLSMGYITLDTVSELLIYPKFWDTSDPDPSNHVPLIAPNFGLSMDTVYGYGNIDGTDTAYYPANFPPFNFPVDVLWNIGNNPSYSNDVNMAFNLGGTLADLSWLDYTGIPLVSFHCENDPFASIDSGVIIVPTTGDIVIPSVVGSRTAAHYNTLWGNNAGFNQAGLTDTLTQMANSYNSAWDAQHGLVYDGLYVFDTPAPSTTPNAFGEMPYHESSPWDWWDLATYDAMFAAVNGAPAGYGAANSLLGSPNSGSDSIPMMYLDTVHGYLNPRMYEVLGLGGSTTDMNEIIEKTTQVYPNPAKDNLNIVSYAELINSVEVYNLSGQKVLSKKVNATTTRLNTNRLSKGVYIVDIKSNVSSVKKKVIIE
jgi:acetyl esterase/lipase